MAETQIICDDVIHWAANYGGPKFHALLCDPPYGMEFMGMAWDTFKNPKGASRQRNEWKDFGSREHPREASQAARIDRNKNLAYEAFIQKHFKALAEHLLPGAFGMVFGSSRSWHRLAVAIEDSGFRIHPSIFGWCYGSGFPKASRIGERVRDDDGKLKLIEDERFTGRRYGLQALKPALEPIIVFQKLYEGKPVDSITATGAGSLWIDGARIGTGDHLGRPQGTMPQPMSWGDKSGDEDAFVTESHPQGRWPANFILRHLDDHDCTRCGGKWPECPDCHGTGTVAGCRRVGTERVRGITGGEGKTTQSIGGRGAYQGGDNRGFFHHADADGLEETAAWNCHPDCPVAKLGEQSGERVGFRGFKLGAERQASWGKGGYSGSFPTSLTSLGYSDKGTAARFFFQSGWSYEIAERLASADPVKYQAKASSRERSEGLNGFWFTGKELSGGGGTKNEKADAYQACKTDRRNPHPTVKPIALAKWLCKLLLPPPEYAPRRILIPFSGTSSEGIGAMLAGWEEIVMIEVSAEYAEIAEARLKYWAARPKQLHLTNIPE